MTVFLRFRPLAGAAIVAAVGVAYANTFRGVFVFDDYGSIVLNPTIRHLWPLGAVLRPPGGDGLTVEGRPLLNFSFAINYAISGTKAWSYHALNLLIHAAAALVLFGILRRSLRAAGSRTPPLAPAFVAALLWAVHPLQTESVTYVVQRAESLMGLFYLLTLYCFIRAVSQRESSGVSSAVWLGLSGLACLFGMATKEVMVSAPAIVLCYDRAFVSGGFHAAWVRRRGYYLGLACTWGLPAWLAISAPGRGGTAGFGIGISWWRFAATQLPAIVHYLRLCAWPSQLVFDYGTGSVLPWDRLWPYAAAVGALLGTTVWAFLRRPAAGFFGLWFFAIIAPTSLIPGVRQIMAEHRMYLALAPLAAGFTLILVRGLGRRAPIALALLALPLGLSTVRRNEDYRSALALWGDAVAKRPGNAYAQNTLGSLLAREPGRQAEAARHFQAALSRDPDYAEAHDNYAVLLAHQPGEEAAAVAQYEAALRLKPGDASAHNNFANLLFRLPGRERDAEIQYEAALRLRPDDAAVHTNYAMLLLRRPGGESRALAQLEIALKLNPRFEPARTALQRLEAGGR